MATLQRIRQKIIDREYYLSSHAEDEMLDDELERKDIENAILSYNNHKKWGQVYCWPLLKINKGQKQTWPHLLGISTQFGAGIKKSSESAKALAPNRNGILHGSRKHLDFGTERNSFKAFSLLAFLAFVLADKRDVDET